MSTILNKLSGLKAAQNKEAKTPMTDEQVAQCKAAIVRDNRGYNVHPNRFDVETPYRVAINYDNNWANFGMFKSADVAAAVGTIVSAAYFGENARLGSYDEEVVNNSDEYKKWLANPKSAETIARANGELPCFHALKMNASKNATTGQTEYVF